MPRVLTDDPAARRVELFHYDDATDSITLETVQDVEPIIQANKALANEHSSLDRYGDLARVASIPMAIYWDLKRRGILDDDAALRRWLNDPDNRFFRTRPGVV